MFESYSLLEVKMDEAFFKLNEMLNKDQDPSIKLCSTNLHELLKKAKHSLEDNKIEAAMEFCLSECGNDNIVHFLFDEVDGSYFTERNALGLKNYVTKSISHEATVILALQPTQKKQTVHNEKVEHKVKSFCQEDNKTGMVLLEPLTKSMRMVSKVYKLKRIAERIIQMHSTKLALKNDENSTFKDTNIEQPTAIEATNEQIHENEEPKENSRNDKPCSSKDQQKKRDQDDGNVLHKVDTANKMAKTDDKEMNNSQMPIDHQPIHNRDAFTENVDQSSKVFEFEIGFHVDKCGVSIEGSNEPSIIYLNEEFDIRSSKGASILKMVFETEAIINRSAKKKTTIICNDWAQSISTLFSLSSFEDWEYCSYIPFMMENGIPTKEKKRTVLEACNNSRSHSVLVTDFQGFRGCEAEVCITFVHPDESYLRHIIVEVLARAVTNLIVIVLPAKLQRTNQISKHDQGNFQQVIEDWVKEKVVAVYKVVISGNKFSLEKENEDVKTKEMFNEKIDDSFKSFQAKWKERRGTSHPEPSQ